MLTNCNFSGSTYFHEQKYLFSKKRNYLRNTKTLRKILEHSKLRLVQKLDRRTKAKNKFLSYIIKMDCTYYFKKKIPLLEDL